MTVLSFDDTNGNGITRDDDMDAGAPPTANTTVKGTSYGGSGAQFITLAFYEGAGALGRKMSSTGGFGFSATGFTSRDSTTATYRTVMAKMLEKNSAALNPAGMDFCWGSATNAQHWVTMGDDGTISEPGFEYPPVGGWIVKPVDLTLNAFRRGTAGNPTETGITVFGAWVDLSSTGGTDRDLLLDAIDYIETGFHVVGGTGADPDVTWQDFIDEDEGLGSTNFDRVGLWRALAAGTFQFFGRNEIGITYGNTVTETDFSDSFKTLICPGGYVREGFNALVFDIGNASSVMTNDNVTVLGTGRSSRRFYFDATAEGASTGGDVDATANEVNYTAHGLFTGQRLLYDRNGNAGSYVTGGAGNGESELVTGTTGEYYYAIAVSADVFAVASTWANALAGTRVSLSAVANEVHYFELGPDTRPDIIVNGNSGTWDWTNGSLNNCRQINLSGDNGEIANTNIITPKTIDLNTGGKITNCSVLQPVRTAGQALMTISGSEFTGVTDTAFTGGDDLRGPGHVFELNSATGSPFASSGNTYSGYASYSGTDHEFDGSSGTVVDTTGNDITITAHPYVDGEVVFYEDNGGTAIGGLTDSTWYYIGSIDANTVALYNARVDALNDTNRISLTGVGTGTTHRFDSANAAIHNNSGSSLTINVTGGDTPSVRNTGAISTTVSNTVTLTVTVTDSNGAAVEGARVRIENASTGAQIAQGTTNASGVFTDSTYNYAGDLSVRTKVRLKGFKFFRTLGTIESTGISVGATLQDDPNVDLP